jgi:uncharacterized protein YcbX
VPIRISGLYYYPVKSCGGTALRSATLGARGIVGDRTYVIVGADGRFVTQREKPRLALITPTLTKECLSLSAPGMTTLDVPVIADARREVVVWGEVIDADDQGADVAEWLSHFLGGPHQLARISNADARMSWTVRGAPSTYKMAFADAYPVLMTSVASLDDLNGRLENPVAMDRFRPNVVVDGAPAFAEDDWKRVRIGSVDTTVAAACIRCVIISVNQDTGKRGVEPLRTLATFRRDDEGGVAFGQNLVYKRGGEIRVGDAVEVID